MHPTVAQVSSRELKTDAGLGSRGLTNLAGAWARILDDNLCVALLERCSERPPSDRAAGVISLTACLFRLVLRVRPQVRFVNGARRVSLSDSFVQRAAPCGPCLDETRADYAAHSLRRRRSVRARHVAENARADRPFAAGHVFLAGWGSFVC
jgi:hypothetical protein